MRITLLFLTTALALQAPLVAIAQPSYATQGEAQIRGRITAFDGHYALQVQDEKGYSDSVTLHDGTIINPTGLTLAPGMTVSILGYNAGSTFNANEIDTPYTFYGGVPYYSGHPWFYYGPAVSLGFFFGNYGWWHGGAFVRPYSYYNGARVYHGVPFNQFYHGGTYHGPNYVAPPEHGGWYGHGGPPPGHAEPMGGHGQPEHAH